MYARARVYAHAHEKGENMVSGTPFFPLLVKKRRKRRKKERDELKKTRPLSVNPHIIDEKESFFCVRG